MTKSTDIVVGNFLVTFCFFCSRFFRILNNKYSARSTFSSRVCRLSLHVAYLKNKKKKRPGGRKQKASRFTYLELGSRTCETLAEIRLGIEGVPGVGHRSQSQSHMWALTRGYRLAAEGFLFVSFFQFFLLRLVGEKEPVAERQWRQNSPKLAACLRATLHSSECQKVEVCNSLYSGT